MSYYPRLLGVWYSPDYYEYWSENTVTSEDLFIASQPIQERKLRVRVMDKGYGGCLYIIEGKLISFDINIDAQSATRRTCNLSMALHLDDELEWRDIGVNNFLMLEEGCKNFQTGEYKWYSKGYYVVTDYNLTCNNTSKIISLHLSDSMAVINGERDGVIKGFEPQIKVTDYDEQAIKEVSELESQLALTEDISERAEIQREIKSKKTTWINNILIDEVMNDIMTQFYNTSAYRYGWEFIPICNDYGMQRILDNEWNWNSDLEQYCVPYDIQFPTGVTMYEVLDKLTNLYVGYELFFDVYNCLKVRHKPTIESKLNNTSIYMNQNDWNGLIVSEEINRDLKSIFNSCTVWGKDGIYCGSAKDIGLSYSSINHMGLVHKEFSGENYANCETDEDCEAWAQYLLENSLKYHDTITVTLKNCAFINEVNYLVKYPSNFQDTELSEKVRKANNFPTDSVFTCIIDKISSSFTEGTTTITLIRYDELSSYKYKKTSTVTLNTPVITSCITNALTLSVNFDDVQYAETYYLYCDGKIISSSTISSFVYEFTADDVGQHSIYVSATSDNFGNSKYSDQEIILIVTNVILDSNNETILDSNGEAILDNN